MGLFASCLKHLIRCSKGGRLNAPLLTLGNQSIFATKDDCCRYLAEEDFSYCLPNQIHLNDSRTLIRMWPESKKFIHAVTFFELLGIPQSDYYDVDKHDFDKPKLLADLEQPFGDEYVERFNTVIDGGTLEHTFDIKSVMSNIVRVLRVGGYVYHLSPVNNFINHGFYQLSPTLFHDFYTLNGFEVVDSYLLERTGELNGVHRFHLYDHGCHYPDFYFNSTGPLHFWFSAKKLSHVDDITSPVMLKYQRILDNPEMSYDIFNKRFEGTYFDL
ncbi:MAG: hypothetical protein HQL04_00560 [Nitrospirae bacterium]|nr:hypothetical protein [Nitrospirota bacterium]